MEICFATHNIHKLEEIQAKMPGDIRLISLDDLKVTEEIPETAETLEGNALLKASFINEHFGRSCFADDTGLEVEALHNSPGVYSARYAGPEKDNLKNMALLLENLKGEQNRRARFRTVICLIHDGATHYFEGVVPGTITDNAAGSQGFGYDPVFVPEGYDRTFAEMSMTEKNRISHRALAVEKLVDFLKKKT